MHLSQKTVCTLAVIAVILCIVNARGPQKVTSCCNTASKEKINLPIMGFQLQEQNPPCIKAVIFFTSEGPMCSHWEESWVIEKVKELRRIQAMEAGLRNNSTATPLTNSSP